MTRLHDKVTVVTGAGSGIGRAIALACAAAGARVVAGYNASRESAEQLVGEITAGGGTALAAAADITDPAAVQGLLDAARERFGRIDVWVNNAGADILTGAGAAWSDEQKLDALVNVDLKGTIRCCWAVAPLMRRQGSGVIINTSWDQALTGYPGTNPQMFAAVKAGVQAFSKSLAGSVAPQVRVNVLAPGWIATAFAEDVMEREYYAARCNEIPLQRFGRPAEVAAAAVFLASAEASYITGSVLTVGGGVA